MGPKSVSFAKGSSSNRKANALGFAKRHSRKAEAKTEATSDVYEYSSGKNKRSAVTLSLDKDEAMGMGLDGNEDVEFDRDALRARIMSTEKAGDAIINSEDDEEIESDDAFEDSDEDRFAGFSFAKKPSSKTPKRKPNVSTSGTAVRFVDVDLDEDEPERQSEKNSAQGTDDEEIDGASDEFLDVLDVLDGRGKPDFGDDEEDEEDEEDDERKDGEDEEEAEAEDGEDGDEEMGDAFVPSDTEQQIDGDALDHLGAFVSQLEPGKKRRAEDESQAAPGSGGDPPPRKRRMLKERTEAGVEGEFGVHAASGLKLQLDDLLAPLTSTSSSLQALKKSTKPLTKGDALSAPLPQRTQDRLDREAAYEQTKEEVDKWKATMKRIKEADHLSFPLQVAQKVNPSNSELAAKFKPSTELESAVDKLLRAAQMRDEGDIAKTEELKMNHLSVEEVAERRAELRKMRELMFRAEAKAKRVAKIKSKTYRKIQRKGRERVKGLIKEAEGLDGEEDGEEERMKREMERARERATLRHKNTGKWAKAMKARGELEGDQRREIEEMLEKGEMLRAKIRGGNGSEDDDDSEAEGGVEGIKASAFEELRRLERDDAAEGPLPKGKGVFGMKFMQDAMAREQMRVGEAADEFRDEMARMQGESEGEAAEDEDIIAGPSGIQVQRMGGRMVYRPGQTMVSPWPIALSESSSTLKSSEPALESPTVASHLTMHSSPPLHPDNFAREPSPLPPSRTTNADPNPWLLPRDSAATQSRRKNEVLIGKDSAGAAKTKNQMKKRLMKGDEERGKARDDAVVEISMDEVLKLPGEPSAQEGLGKKAKLLKVNGKEKDQPDGQRVDAAFEDSDENSEVEAQERRIKTKGKGKGVRAFEQRDLVALAFAGDNVVQDFEKLKQREVQADAPRDEDHTLPGWGSWGGSGTRRNPKAKKFVKKIAGVDPASRADHGKPHLIISEKKDKKAAKYLTKDLPYPYTSKAQFEKSMEVPIGTEWNTRVGFQRQTLPRVVKKMGTVIDPLEKMF